MQLCRPVRGTPTSVHAQDTTALVDVSAFERDGGTSLVAAGVTASFVSGVWVGQAR